LFCALAALANLRGIGLNRLLSRGIRAWSVWMCFCIYVVYFFLIFRAIGGASYPSAGFVNIKISKISWYLRYFRYFQKCTCREGRTVKYKVIKQC